MIQPEECEHYHPKISCWFRWVCQSSTRTWPGDRRGLCRVPTCASHGLFNFLSICSNSSVLSWFLSRDSPWKMGTLGMSRKRCGDIRRHPWPRMWSTRPSSQPLRYQEVCLLILDEDATPFSRDLWPELPSPLHFHVCHASHVKTVGTFA